MNIDNLMKALECRAGMNPPFDCEHCDYLDRSDDWGTCDAKKLGMDAIDLLKEQEEKIKSLEQTIEDVCCG